MFGCHDQRKYPVLDATKHQACRSSRLTGQGVLHGRSRETVAWGRELLGGNGIVANYNVTQFTDAEALCSYEGTYQMANLIG